MATVVTPQAFSQSAMADHVHVGVDVDAGRIGVEDGQGRWGRAWRPGWPGRGACLDRGRLRWLMVSAILYQIAVIPYPEPGAFPRQQPDPMGGDHRDLVLGGWGEASRGRTRGERVDAVSPTGSTHRQLPMRVTNDRVATSRARLYEGHEAPVGSRPRTRAGCCTIHPTVLSGGDLAGAERRRAGNWPDARPDPGGDARRDSHGSQRGAQPG